MSYDVFLNQVSLNMAQRFVELISQKELPISTQQINTSGVSGTRTEEVKDIVAKISRDRFKEIACINNPVENLETHVNTFWDFYKSSDHRIVAETLITASIRKLGKLYDCAHLETYQENLEIHFRHSSELITQHPQPFNPLFSASFDTMQEVIQGEFALTHPKAEKPSLSTWHLASCVALIAFDKIHKLGLLAHIDDEADLPDLFGRIVDITHQFTKDEVKYDYILLGGRNHDERDRVNKVIPKDDLVSFTLIKEVGVEEIAEAILIDSFWGVSMRLSRSVVLNTQDPSPLENLQSYEPHLNPDSAYHKRKFTRLEAYTFETNREREKVLNLSYCALPKSY